MVCNIIERPLYLRVLHSLDLGWLIFVDLPSGHVLMSKQTPIQISDRLCNVELFGFWCIHVYMRIILCHTTQDRTSYTLVPSTVSATVDAKFHVISHFEKLSIIFLATPQALISRPTNTWAKCIVKKSRCENQPRFLILQWRRSIRIYLTKPIIYNIWLPYTE